MFEKIIGACANPEIGDITDLKEGYDFRVNRRKKDGYWNYDLSEAARKTSPVSADPAKVTELMGNLFDLDKEVTILTYLELKGVLDNALAQITGGGAQSAPAPIARVEQKVEAIQKAPEVVPPSPTLAENENMDTEIANFKKNLEDLKTQK